MLFCFGTYTKTLDTKQCKKMNPNLNVYNTVVASLEIVMKNLEIQIKYKVNYK